MEIEERYDFSHFWKGDILRLQIWYGLTNKDGNLISWNIEIQGLLVAISIGCVVQLSKDSNR